MASASLLAKLIREGVPKSTAKRAAEGGFSDEVFYHGTHADIDEFDVTDIGVHLGTKEQANNRLYDVYGERRGESTTYGGRSGQLDDGANVMPLKTRTGKTLEMPDVGRWDDSEQVLAALEDLPEFRGRLDDAWEDLGVKYQFEDTAAWVESSENREMLDEINKMLQSDGYESVKYKNAVENTYHSAADTPPDIRDAQNNLYDKIRPIDEAARERQRLSNPMPPENELLNNPNAVDDWHKRNGDINDFYTAQEKETLK